MPSEVLCGAVQDLCQCLAPILEGGGLLNLEMLDIAEKDPPAASASPTQKPKEEEQITLQVPKELCTSEPEEAAHSAGGLDLVQGGFPSVPPGFACLHVNQTHTGLARGIPLGAWLDLCSLGSLQVTISHYSVVREVCCEYQSQVITQGSLQVP